MLRAKTILIFMSASVRGLLNTVEIVIVAGDPAAARRIYTRYARSESPVPSSSNTIASSLSPANLATS